MKIIFRRLFVASAYLGYLSFALGTIFTSTIHAQTIPNKIEWLPAAMSQYVPIGTICVSHFAFISNATLKDVSIQIYPSSSQIYITPMYFSEIEKDKRYTVTVSVVSSLNNPITNNGFELKPSSGQVSEDSLYVNFFSVATDIRTPTPIADKTQSPLACETDPYSKIDRALAKNKIALDDAAIYRLYGLFENPELPCKFQSPISIPADGLGAYAYALKDFQKLSPETQKKFSDFMTPREITLEPGSPNVATPPSPCLAAERNSDLTLLTGFPLRIGSTIFRRWLPDPFAPNFEINTIGIQ